MHVAHSVNAIAEAVFAVVGANGTLHEPDMYNLYVIELFLVHRPFLNILFPSSGNH